MRKCGELASQFMDELGIIRQEVAYQQKLGKAIGDKQVAAAQEVYVHIENAVVAAKHAEIAYRQDSNPPPALVLKSIEKVTQCTERALEYANHAVMKAINDARLCIASTTDESEYQLQEAAVSMDIAALTALETEKEIQRELETVRHRAQHAERLAHAEHIKEGYRNWQLAVQRERQLLIRHGALYVPLAARAARNIQDEVQAYAQAALANAAMTPAIATSKSTTVYQAALAAITDCTPAPAGGHGGAQSPPAAAAAAALATLAASAASAATRAASAMPALPAMPTAPAMPSAAPAKSEAAAAPAKSEAAAAPAKSEAAAAPAKSEAAAAAKSEAAAAAPAKSEAAADTVQVRDDSTSAPHKPYYAQELATLIKDVTLELNTVLNSSDSMYVFAFSAVARRNTETRHITMRKLSHILLSDASSDECDRTEEVYFWMSKYALSAPANDVHVFCYTFDDFSVYNGDTDKIPMPFTVRPLRAYKVQHYDSKHLVYTEVPVMLVC
jgi:acetolactate synthase regulatory subunit